MGHDFSDPCFELPIIALADGAPVARSGLPPRGPLPALLHRAPGNRGKIVLYVPGGVSGAALGELYDYGRLATQLAAIGVSLIVLQMSTSQRPTPDPLADCVDDIQSALAWCAAEGFDHVCLAGNGLGAARIACWAGQASGAAVKSMLLLSPAESPYLAIERCGSSERRAARDKVLRLCKDLTVAGRGGDIVEADLDGAPRAYTAAGFIDCFGPPEQASASIMRFAGRIDLPVCIIHGDCDPVAPPEGASAVLAGLARAPERKLVWIAGGDHHLLGNPATVEPTVDAICGWLAE